MESEKYLHIVGEFSVFMAIAIVPLLVLGFYSYHSAVSAVRDSIRQSNETALLQVENRTENVLDAVRQDFSYDSWTKFYEGDN